MKHGSNARLSVLAGVFLSASSIAVTSRGAAADNPNPYSAIVERNVFNLHPPPPPVNPADLIKKTPPPKITLTGITTILGKKVTFLTTPPTKPGGQPESVMLSEGQAQNDIEVKSIDEKAQVVQVINHGEPQTLDFDNNGAKPSGPPTGAPTPITLPAPQPAAPPAGVQPMPNAGSMIRPLRSLPARNSGADNNGGAGLGGGVSAGNLGQQQNNLSADEQVALIELQRTIAIKNNDPVKDILPPTELTPEVTGQPGTPTPSGL